MLTSGKLHPFSDRDLLRETKVKPRSSNLPRSPDLGGKKRIPPYSLLALFSVKYIRQITLFSPTLLIHWIEQRVFFFSASGVHNLQYLSRGLPAVVVTGKIACFSINRGDRGGRNMFFLICTEIPNRINQYFVAVVISWHV